MSLESNSAADEPRDRVRLLWIGVIVLAIVAAIVLWVINRTEPATSQVRVKHILVAFDRTDPEARSRAHETITRLRERIAAGESFEKLAREYSNDQFSAARGGDLGYVKRGTLSENVEKYVWDAPFNTLSDVIETPFGFHLVMVIDRFLSSADQYQRELEERVLRQMEDEKTAAPPADPVPDATEPAEPDDEAPIAIEPAPAPAPLPPPAIRAPADGL